MMSDAREVRLQLEPEDRLELPAAPELHEHVRASRPRAGNAPPPAFVEQQLRIAALEAALTLERGHMHRLVREAHRLGAPVNTLARWSGYTPRWIGRITSAAA
jgi:hypothetical protein